METEPKVPVGTIHVDGLVGDAPDTPVVRAALTAYENSQAEGVAEAITQPENTTLEAYGIKLRHLGLRQSALASRIMAAGIPLAHQLHASVYMLGAPKAEVFKAVEILEKKGQAEFLTIVDDWFDKMKIPDEATTECAELLTNSLQLVEKLMPKSNENEEEPPVLKKNPLPGTPSPST